MDRIFKITIIIALASVTAAGIASLSGSAEDSSEDYIMGDVSTLPADFVLDVKASSESGPGTPVINKVCIFTISRDKGSGSTALSGLYDISYFVENTYSGIYRGRDLPFRLKQNFRGIVDGDYHITFVARDKAGKIGKGDITIRVRH